MYLSDIPEGVPEDGASLASVEAAIGGVASGLDARFVEAGNALAEAYAIVEKLVGALEGVTNALDRDAADAAIANMRATADRLMQLPAVQAARGTALRTIGDASAELQDEIARVNRTLSFLRICGLNIKVAAEGSREFSGFADTMFEKLDLAESEMSGIAREIERLAESIDGVFDVEAHLEAECAKVVPHVPERLAGDALALQAHQGEVAARAAEVAQIARDIRAKVATALGALQIGDITRQRLEHIADGVRLVEAGGGQGDTAEAVAGHVLALLAAQTADTVENFERESRLLTQSLRGIAPSAGALVALKGTASDGDGATFLHKLEASVAEVESVTARLREADGRSGRLSSATSATADSLAERLKKVHRVKNDVQHMAWNTDLRCHRMGPEGRALAVVASEIRGFANTLEAISAEISVQFEALAGAAGAIRGGQGDGAAAPLAESLHCIRDGGRRMREGLAGLDQDAATVAAILSDTTDKVDCEAEVGPVLAEATARLAALGRHAGEPSETVAGPLGELLDTIARSYTMAREREVHRRFALGDAAEAPVAEAAAGDDDDFDDGLF